MELCVWGASLIAGARGQTFLSLSHADLRGSRGESTYPPLCTDKTFLVDTYIYQCVLKP